MASDYNRNHAKIRRLHKGTIKLQVIKLKAKLYSSLKDRGFGLIGKNKPETVMFITRFGIHTLALKFPIDVIVLNENNIVAKLSENLPPNRFFVWPIKYDKVLELPAGTINKKKIKLGDTINLKVEI